MKWGLILIFLEINISTEIKVFILIKQILNLISSSLFDSLNKLFISSHFIVPPIQPSKVLHYS